MLTIKMLSDKSLVITKAINIYQRQSLVDNMQILIPLTYSDNDLTKFNATLEYIDPANMAHTEILVKDEELYNDTMIRFTLDMDTKFTYLAGDITMKLTLTYFDEGENKKYILKTGELTLKILKLNDYFLYADESSFTTIDNKIMELQAQTDKLAAMAGIYAESVPDDLTIDDTALLQLSANGTPIGNGVQLASAVDENDDKDDGVIDLDSSANDEETAVIDL